MKIDIGCNHVFDTFLTRVNDVYVKIFKRLNLATKLLKSQAIFNFNYIGKSIIIVSYVLNKT